METIVTTKSGLSGVINSINNACDEWEKDEKIKELQGKIDTVYSTLSNWNEDGKYTNILNYLKQYK